MDKIFDLTLAYPDFQLNQIIDPDQVDMNNAQIVQRVNEIASKFNALIDTNGGGASNISVNPLPQFVSAKNVQTTLESIVNTLVGVTGASFVATACGSTIQDVLNEIDATIVEYGKRIISVENRASQLESKDVVHTNKISAIELKNQEQDSKLNGVDTTLSEMQSTNVTQSTDIQQLKQRDIYHDEQIAIAHSKNGQQDGRLTTVENVANTSKADIVKMKQDIANINTTNTNQEVIDARGTHDNLADRMDYTEIAIGSNQSSTAKLNMLITDSDDPLFWEDKLPTASLAEHNNDINAHGGRIDSHNTSPTAHEDIRTAINNMVTDWDGIPGKPTLFPPTVHAHTKSQISDFAHTHTKSQISDFAHTHTKANITDFAHTHNKNDIGLNNVNNVEQMPITGGTFTGNVSMASNVRLSGHVAIPIGKPANTVNGSIWVE